MRVLVRLHHPEFHRWGIELLVSQLYDKSRAVSLTALDVLDEACELQVTIFVLKKVSFIDLTFVNECCFLGKFGVRH